MFRKLKILFGFAAPYKLNLVLNIVCNLFTVIFSLFSITMIVPFLKLLFTPTQELVKIVKVVPAMALTKDAILGNAYAFLGNFIVESGSKEKALFFVCIIVLVLFTLKNLFRYFALFFVTPMRTGIVRDLRNRIYKKILGLPLSYYSEERKGDIMARVSNDVQEVEWSVLTSIEMIFRDPPTIIAYLVALFAISPKLTVFTLILLPISGGIIGLIGKSLRKTSLVGQRKIGALMTVVEETLGGLKVIQAFSAESYVTKKFSSRNESYNRTQISMNRTRDLASPLSETMGTAVMVVLIWFGGNLVLDNSSRLSPELFLGYIIIFSQLLTPAKSFSTAYYSIQKGLASIQRINEILKTDNPIKEKIDAKDTNGFHNAIEYRNVDFSYIENRPVLKNINFTLEKGKTIALVGESGGGKSTIADLLPRFYDVQGGDILIDGIGIKDYKISELRKLIGVVTQQSILFNDTVYNNIAFGTENVTKEDVIRAAQIANAEEFILGLDENYYTNIGDGGCKLSGGQKQRLTIARAVLRNPPILVLDEATSALDTESERLVQDALIKLMENRTSIVIAHRLSTIQHAHEIYVIQNGEFVEKGTHSELFALNGAYRRLYDMQMFS